MEFYQLEYLCAVVERGGYNQAGRHLSRVPSAIKRGVALLENEIGIKLLYREGRSVRLTEHGENLARWARSTIESRAIMMDGIRNQGSLQGRVVVATSHAVVKTTLVRFKRFMMRNPQVEILILRRRGFEVGGLIETGEADFGYLPLEHCPATLQWHKSVELKTLLAIPKHHSLARKRSITLGDIVRTRLILPDRHASYAGLRVLRAFQENGHEYRPLVETADSRLRLGFARMGLGIGVVLEQEISSEMKRALKLVDVSDLFGKSVYGIAWRKKGYLPQAARQLIRALQPEVHIVGDDTDAHAGPAFRPPSPTPLKEQGERVLVDEGIGQKPRLLLVMAKGRQ